MVSVELDPSWQLRSTQAVELYLAAACMTLSRSDLDIPGDIHASYFPNRSRGQAEDAGTGLLVVRGVDIISGYRATILRDKSLQGVTVGRVAIPGDIRSSERIMSVERYTKVPRTRYQYKVNTGFIPGLEDGKPKELPNHPREIFLSLANEVQSAIHERLATREDIIRIITTTAKHIKKYRTR